jgi:PAS domain S-box-containing protein
MAAMLGRSAADMIGRSIYDFMQQDTRLEVERTFERVRDGLAEQRDVRFQRADGADLWTIVSIHPIFEEDRRACRCPRTGDRYHRAQADGTGRA